LSNGAGLGQPINSFDNPTGVSGSGFVGINTMFPSYTLDVAIRATGNLRVEGITTHTVSAKMHFGDIGKGLSYSGNSGGINDYFDIFPVDVLWGWRRWK
jgi:hypothetical protein